ncbi:MAG TPA: 50S ribosomal protein L35 [Candidatus Omnitrophica bacterium]|nr:50S ribosomal protein L35 [Candidatus Omnitrophota bacterium]
MAKLKTNKSAAKRMWRTGTGKIKRTRAAKGHLLTHKTQKRKRHLRKAALVSKSEVAKVRRMLPYG